MRRRQTRGDAADQAERLAHREGPAIVGALADLLLERRTLQPLHRDIGTCLLSLRHVIDRADVGVR